jgi:2-(1,2-epoxy-1,2-dihydrophenyl)acetyl-CoA isomerase
MAYAPDPFTPGLSIDTEGPVLRIRFDRPDKRNALTRPILDRLVHLVETATERPDLRAIMISGEGRDFCSGVDLLDANQRQEQKPRVGDIQRRLPRQAHRLILALLNVQLPVVSIVRGIASGIGAHLAFASDFILASDTVRFVEPFVSRGFSPDSGGSFLLVRLVGLARARDVLLLGREIDAATAERWDLVHRIVPDHDLVNVGNEFVRRLAEGPTIALGLTKWLMNRAFDVSADDALANEAFALELTSRTGDFKEGLRAFTERRKPSYEGR